jgi:hypothetical protein
MRRQLKNYLSYTKEQKTRTSESEAQPQPQRLASLGTAKILKFKKWSETRFDKEFGMEPMEPMEPSRPAEAEIFGNLMLNRMSLPTESDARLMID